MNHIHIDATYSAEDNKLRLHASERLDTELYQRVRDMGFKWAPKQQLFVAPKWTPEREDFCVELAGTIEAEGTTLVERAEAKAARLDQLSIRRAGQADAFQDAARRISERFVAGQPILVGHHSERKARKDKERMDSAMRNAVKAREAVGYWAYRAEGVEHHANRKADPKVRARRIRTLVAELRDRQRRINHAHKCLELWQNIETLEEGEKRDQTVKHFAGVQLTEGAAAPYQRGDSLWSQLEQGLMTSQEVIDACLNHWGYVAASSYNQRWIGHILNRLAYERSELGEVPRFDEELTPVILQAFAREQGADKPKATANDTGFVLTSNAPLPCHLGEGKSLELSNDQWRDLMQSVGHAVVIQKRQAGKRPACPLVNPTDEQAEKLQALWNQDANQRKYGKPSERREVTQQYYSANAKGDYGMFSTVALDERGRRIWNSRDNKTPVVRVRISSGSELYSADRVITLSDKPTKALPLDLDALLAEPAVEEA